MLDKLKKKLKEEIREEKTFIEKKAQSQIISIIVMILLVLSIFVILAGSVRMIVTELSGQVGAEGTRFIDSLWNFGEDRKLDLSHIKTAQAMYRGDIIAKDGKEEAEFLATHIDLAVNGKPSFKEYNKNFKPLKYMYLTISYQVLSGVDCNKYATYYCYFKNWADEKGYTDEEIENVFLHYDEPTTIKIDMRNQNTNEIISDEISIPPYESVEDKSESRVQAYGWSDYIWIPNFKSEIYKEYIFDEISKYVSEGYDGIFIDENVLPKYPYSDSANKVIKGGLMREYPEDRNIKYSERTKSAYYSDGLELIKEIKREFPNFIVSANVGHIIDKYPGVEEVSKFVVREHYIDLKLNEIDDVDLSYVKEKSDEGIKQILNYDGNINEMSVNRNRMTALVIYYLMQTPNTYFGILTMDAQDASPEKKDEILEDNSRNLGKEPLSKNWFRAIEFDVGESLGEYYLFNEAENIYAREYENALVLARLKYSGNGVEIELGENYKILNADGSIEGEVQKISLGAVEGVILIKI